MGIHKVECVSILHGAWCDRAQTGYVHPIRANHVLIEREGRTLTIEAPGVSVRVADRYELGERLGAGGMAVVYRATDDVLGREVAIKLFGPAVDADHPERIQTEMRTIASLSHPGLVSVYDGGTDEQPGSEARAFLVMELIDGPTLAECVIKGPLAPERVR